MRIIIEAVLISVGKMQSLCMLTKIYKVIKLNSAATMQFLLFKHSPGNGFNTFYITYVLRQSPPNRDSAGLGLRALSMRGRPAWQTLVILTLTCRCWTFTSYKKKLSSDSMFKKIHFVKLSTIRSMWRCKKYYFPYVAAILHVLRITRSWSFDPTFWNCVCPCPHVPRMSYPYTAVSCKVYCDFWTTHSQSDNDKCTRTELGKHDICFRKKHCKK